MAKPQLRIVSDDINALIYSYLEDAGFLHTAYALRHEGRLDASPNLNVRIPRGELVKLLSKSLMYMEVEAHYRRDPNEPPCNAPFSILKAHMCSHGQHSLPSPPELGHPRPELFPPPRPSSPSVSGEKRKASPKSDGRIEKRLRTEPNGSETQAPEPGNDGPILQKGYGDGVILLNGHESEVFVCQWHPTSSHVLATGSKDATVRIWNVPTPPAPLRVPLTLKHTPEIGEVRDITAIDWDPTGNRLATGSYDGIVRLWSPDGLHKHNLTAHTAPIFSVKWSPCGTWLLSGSLDHTTVVWNMSSQKPDKPEQVFKVHRASVLDVNWIDSTTFVSCSVDKLIHICRIGSTEPIRTFSGHEDEVNLVRLSKDRSLLASSSDDRTVRIWDLGMWKEEGPEALKLYPSETADKVLKGVLRGHDREIGSLGWCPNPDGKEHILVTTSFDRCVRVWDANNGTCLRELRDHEDRVFTHSFSSKGRYLATGAGDGRVLVYELSTGKRVFEWHCDAGGIFEIDWQKTGNKIGLCLENKGVAVLDMEKFGLIDYRPPATS